MSSGFRAGTALIDISPTLGTSLAGYMQDRRAELIHDPLHARCLVLESGGTKVAVVVCDLVAVGGAQVSAARHLIHGHTGIPMQHILIAATHTHSGATSVPIFQSDPDPRYLEWLVTRIADGVRCAARNVIPARVGWTTAQEPGLVFNRRFFMKPGSITPNPFGGIDQVKMNPGNLNPNIIKPAGPTDPELSMLALQTREGRPLALLASYALHYVGNNPGEHVSADYFAMWGQEVARNLNECCLAGPQERPGFLPILANACSGDINNIDVSRKFSQSYEYAHMREVARQLADRAVQAWKKVQFAEDLPLAALETTIELKLRKPTAADIERARRIIAQAGPNLTTLPQIYARETVLLAERPDSVRVPIMAIRVGDFAIITFPGEAFVELGLEVKKNSPFAQTMCIELANDFAGYIPTARHHELGGYETWRARSSCLEVAAAERMVQSGTKLLHELHAS
jgi:hypothetical protein